MSTELYIKIEQHVEVNKKKVLLSDIAKLHCAKFDVAKELSNIMILNIETTSNSNYAMTFMKVVELIHRKRQDITVINEGEKDFIIEYIPNPEKPKWINALKTVALCVVIFFGAAFTIMAFNNDVSVGDVFSKFYRQVMGKESSGVTELEICYSIGLAIGITLFFNHVGSKKITPDPTPMQVEMRKYEKDIDTTFIENAERKGHSIDVN